MNKTCCLYVANDFFKALFQNQDGKKTGDGANAYTKGNHEYKKINDSLNKILKHLFYENIMGQSTKYSGIQEGNQYFGTC